ncbi:hypothetical protein [Lacipirellula parvula]|uniref:Uncharacterized protein n=1 Tax=Lacipirellula parvula TaxID=2650471 RepID=A0A5K7X493_9BACT|nr:hypothetical protein [Lacipirellula parvula]BBO30647.1 hypothetical protein PLANPX_0259 [Lacipirellula parvula]
MPRRPFLLLSLVVLLAAVVQAGVGAFSSQPAAGDAKAKACSACGPLGDFCELK